MHRAVLVALVVVFAGCSLPAGSGDDPTVTAAPVPTVDDRTASGAVEGTRTATTATPGPGERPWIVDREFRSAQGLAVEHREALSGTAYRVVERYESVSTGVEVADAVVVQTATTWHRGDTVRHERTRYRAPLSNTSARTWRNVSAFERDGRRYLRTVENGTTTYRVLKASATSAGQVFPNTSRAVAQLMTVENATVDLLFWNGQHYYRIRGTGTTSPGFGLAEDYTVEAVVTTTGLVRRLTVEYTEAQMGREQTIRYEMVVTPLPAGDVERPDWLDEARANATEVGAG